MSFPPTIPHKSSDSKTYEDFKKKKITSCSAISSNFTLLDSSNKSFYELKLSGSNSYKYSPKISDFAIVRPLGRGMFGEVYLAIHSWTGFICAIKIISKESLKGRNKEQTLKFKNQVQREIKIHSFMNHPNIINLYSVFHDEKNLYLMMEYATDGQLYSFLRRQQSFTEETTSYIIREILLAINYIHDNQIIHRDIKPENVIITYGTAKLCDFGWSVHCPKQFRSTVCGTPLYFSPQLLKGQQYDQKIDVWAIGILTHELITGQNPFKIRKRQQITKIVTDNFIMSEGSKSSKDFINSALQKEPQKRITIKNMLKHPFIRKYQQLDFCEELIKFTQYAWQDFNKAIQQDRIYQFNDKLCKNYLFLTAVNLQLILMKNSQWQNQSIIATQRLSSLKRTQKTSFPIGPTQQDYVNLMAKVRLLEDEVVCERIKNQTIQRKNYQYIETIGELEYTIGDLKILLDRTNNQLRKQYDQISQNEGYEKNLKQVGFQLKQLNQIVEKKNRQCQKLIQINSKLKQQYSLIEQKFKQFHQRKEQQKVKLKQILQLLQSQSQPSFNDQMYSDMQLIEEKINELKENFNKTKIALDKCRRQGSDTVIKQKQRIIQLQYALKLAQKRNQDIQRKKNMQSSFVIDKKVQDIIDEMLKKEDELNSRISELQLENQSLRQQLESEREHSSRLKQLNKNDGQKQLKQAKQMIRQLIMQKDNINEKFESLSSIRDFETSRVMTEELQMSRRFRQNCEENKRLKLKIAQLQSDKKMLQKELNLRNYR